MNTSFRCLAVLAVLALSAGRARAQAPVVVVKTSQVIATVAIENQSGQKVDVYDGAFRLASLMPGATATAVLRGTGFRTLTVKSVAWTTSTTRERFEENARWSLNVAMDGTPTLFLKTAR